MLGQDFFNAWKRGPRMRFKLETQLPCSLERAIAEVKKPRLLMHVARPLLRFEPTRGTVVPEEWGEATYWFRLLFLGVLPLGDQAVSVTIQETVDGFTLRDNGHSRLIRRWDHLITIREANGATLYSDTVELDAGFATPVVWLFSRLFFAHRQRRWRRLASGGFSDFDA